MKTEKDWANEVIFFLGELIFWFTLVVTTGLIVVLVMADPLIGTVPFSHWLRDDLSGTLLSLATSGFLFALIATIWWGIRQKWELKVIVLTAIPAVIVYILDIYFDSKAVDVLRYGTLAPIIPPAELGVHYMFRFLVGAVSTFGEITGTLLLFQAYPLLTVIYEEMRKRKREALRSRGISTPARPFNQNEATANHV